MNSLYNISSVDGRYHETTQIFHKYFSEFGLIKYRVLIEIEYLIFLNNYKLMEPFTKEEFTFLFKLHIGFNLEDAKRVKEIESTTKHDVKAIEYFIKEKLESHPTLKKHSHFIHLGLTSQDINSSSNILSIKHGIENIIIPYLNDIFKYLICLSEDWKSIPILSHTHGQPASPSLLGKEILVFVERLHNQLSMLKTVKYTTKFGGAVGNFNAHKLAYPDIDWNNFADKFIENMGLVRETHTTQISNYDNMCNLFNLLKTINNIINDLNIDCWLYISKGYLKQRINENETGSSTMPHKVNPINFENSEGNICIANTLIEGITRKLPVSRLQRDLTDSTILRNIGSVIGYCLLSYKSTLEGLNKITLNDEVIKNELNENSIILSEGIQTVMRKHKMENSYEELKKLTRVSNKITQEDIEKYIEKLNNKVKKELLLLNVENYIGYC